MGLRRAEQSARVSEMRNNRLHYRLETGRRTMSEAVPAHLRYTLVVCVYACVYVYVCTYVCICEEWIYVR